MQKRMVSLLLYVVMLAGLLPTTAMAANDTTAYILDVALQEGYYSTKGDITRDDGTVIEGTDIDMESRLDTAPEGRNNYLHYQDGVLTVFGTVHVDAFHYEGQILPLFISSGTLKVNGSGTLRLYGQNAPALVVTDSAAINFDLTPNGSIYPQLSITSSGNTAAVKGDLTISNASEVSIISGISSDDALIMPYNTIDGNVSVHAESLSVTNHTNGACVNGNLMVEAVDSVDFLNRSETKAVLTGGTYQIKTASLYLWNECGMTVDGDITCSPAGDGEFDGHFRIYGCTTNNVPVVRGNITVTGGYYTALRNFNRYRETTDEEYIQFKDYPADGPLLVGDLTANGVEVDISREQDAGTTPLVTGNVFLNDCIGSGYSYGAKIDKGTGSGAAVNGNINLTNSALLITADYDSDDIHNSGVENCTLTMENSMLSVWSYLHGWDGIDIKDDYEWYVDEDCSQTNPTYIKSTDRPYTNAESPEGYRYLEIRSGDKMSVRAAFLSGGWITGTALQPVSATLYLNLTGDRFDFSKLPGYREVTVESEWGEWTAFGIPAGTELTEYLALDKPQGGIWKLTTAEDAYQDDNSIRVTISGTAGGTNCSEPVTLTISGEILASGEELAVPPNENVRWDITGSPTQATKYDLWVYGEQVTSRNQADILNNGMASFDPQTGTLFLKNADLQGEIKDPVIKSGLDALTLSVTGQNTLRCMEGVVIDAKRLTVMPADADSSLTIRSDQAAAFARNPILPNEAEIWTGDSVDELAYTLLPNYTASKCVKITLHEMQKTWTYDSVNHWHACAHAGCTYKTGMDGHEIEWETEEESYGTTHGVWHKACKVCAYRGASEEMPFFGPEIKTTALPDSEAGMSYRASIAAEGSKPFTWSVVSGALPDGLALNTETGEITGKTQKEGTFTFTVKVQGAAAEFLNATATYTIKVTASSNELRFVKRVTKVSLTNADDETRETVENAIYNLLFKAQFRPVGVSKSVGNKEKAKFSGTKAKNYNFTIQNYDYSAKNERYEAGVIDDAILGEIKVGHVGGCNAYAFFNTVYTYKTKGKEVPCSKTGKNLTAAVIKDFIHKNVDPGEMLRYKYSGGWHSRVFLGESEDGKGFYYINYNGGRRMQSVCQKNTKHKEYGKAKKCATCGSKNLKYKELYTKISDNHHIIQVQYISYSDYASDVKELKTWDTNGGSYYAKTAKAWKDIGKTNKAKKTIIRLNCPVEASVSLNGFILDSEYGPFERSFGTVERVGDGIVFALDYSEDYVLDIRGTGEGTMDAEIEYLDENDVSLGTQCFEKMPITPDTQISARDLSPETTAVLIVDDTETETAWGANLGETATDSDESLLSNNDEPDMSDSEEDTESIISGDSSFPGSSVSRAVYAGNFVNGSVAVSPKTASKGETVTLTVQPDKGYTLEALTVTDQNGTELQLTDKGNGIFTFTMPASEVTVKATFMEDNSMLNFFVDVPAGDYYYDAVLWAAENGITGGVDDTHFAPTATCTRAQAVTFLWRAAGSPAPESSVNPFTDVNAGSYYYDAVLWAVEQGITKGTSDTTFSPNANCTRAQIVTFLWRSQKFPAADGVNPFTDVAADAYYADAVLWAAESGVTSGTTATTFSPNATCTRAQIVTFLYRCMK